MLPVSEELKNKLRKLNESLQLSFPREALEPDSIRKRLEQIGSFYSIKKWDSEELTQWISGRSVVGLDGSVNSTKGIPNKALSVFQALALGTQGEEKWAADIYTPLLEEEEKSEEGQAAREAQKRGAFLSNLEMKLAREILNEWDIHSIILDGSLLHFYMDSAEGWHQVAEKAIAKETYIVGVAEEIGTNRIAKELFPEYSAWSDSDLLYGVLKQGEVFEWEDWSPYGTEMWRVAFRPSMSPQPVCVDGLSVQWKMKQNLLKLVYSLTPDQGRGIPFWLDIIDNQVRVTDSLVEMMVEQYIDPELRHRLFTPKRKDRII